MKFEPCQLDAVTPCCNRGDLCLRTAEERREYNNVIDKMEEMLDDLKLPEVDSTVEAPDVNYCVNANEEEGEG